MLDHVDSKFDVESNSEGLGRWSTPSPRVSRATFITWEEPRLLRVLSLVTSGAPMTYKSSILDTQRVTKLVTAYGRQD